MILNLFGKKEVAEFKKEFHEKEFEMLVLTMEESACIGIVRGNYLQSSVQFAASINLENGEFSEKTGRLEYLNKRNNERKVAYNIEKHKIYQVRVRKCKEIVLEQHQSEIVNNRYMIVKVIKEVYSDEKLDKIKQELLKPVIVKDSSGEFILDRYFSMFEGKINWLSRKCNVHLCTDVENGITANNSFEILHKIVADIESLDKKTRKFASEQLISLANEWSEDSNQEITNEEFMKRLVLEAININSDSIIFYFEDDNMFLGHTILVTMTTDFNCENATIAG